MLRLLLASLLLTGCASFPQSAAPKPKPAYASDPKDRTGWRSPRMCYHLCRGPLLKVRISF